MKENWIADVADFIKYGVIRQLVGAGPDHPQKLGVIWYQTPPDARQPFVGYLGLPPGNQFEQCDAPLFQTMQHLRQTTPLSLAELQSSTVFPENTQFYSATLTLADLPLNDLVGRADRRDHWMAAALQTITDCDIVFLDPDTGIENGNAPRTNDRGIEFAYVTEVLQIAADFQRSVVVTQFGQPPRFGNRQRQIRERLQRLVAANPPERPLPIGVWHEGKHSVGLLVLPAEQHAAAIHKALSLLCSTPPWSGLLAWL